MTDNMTDPDPADATVSEPAEEGDTGTDDSGYVAQLRAEAKGHRLRAVAAETKLEVSEARSQMLLRREIEKIAAARLVEPESIWSDDTDQAALIDDDLGLPDEERVHARCAELIERHRHWARPRPQGTPPASVVTSDNYPGKGNGGQPQTMADVFREAVRG